MSPLAQTSSSDRFDSETKEKHHSKTFNETKDQEEEQKYIDVPTLEEPRNLTPAELALEQKLIRKIDIRLMPMLILLYILNYLDRNSPSQARDNGLETDLNLQGQEYNTCLSILYVGYILFQVPSNLLMAKLGKPRLYLAVCVALWGIISALSAVVHNFTGLLLVRFFFGVIESAFFPGALFVISSWYTKKEMATRMAMLFSGSILSNALAGLIAAGIFSGLEDARGIAGWRWLFLVEGVITVFIALLAPLVLPDMPANTAFLSEEERALAVKRLVLDSGEEGDEGGAAQGFIMAMKDVKVWALTFLLLSGVIVCSFNAFIPTVMLSLGYTKVQTLLITVGPWTWAFIIVLLNALHADKTRERSFHIIGPFIPGILGFIIASCTDNIGARLFAIFIICSSYAGYVVILSFITSCVPRPTYKRSVALSFVNAFSQLGNVSGSYVWSKSWGPSYWRSNLICACSALVVIAITLGLRAHLQRENQKLDEATGGLDDLPKASKDEILRDSNLSLELKLMAKSNIRYLL